MKNKKNGLMRWGKKGPKAEYGPENRGKVITDNNPYVDIDGEAFDYYIENIKLPPQHSLSKKYLLKDIFDRHKAVTGNYTAYIPRIFWNMIRQYLEVKGIIKHKVSKEKETDLLKLKKEISEFVEKEGFISRFTRIDRRYISDEKDELFPYDTMLLLAMNMDKEQIEEMPFVGKKSSKIFNIEADAGKRQFKIAKFIRSKGYNCHVKEPLGGSIKYGPHAVNSGMTNYTTNGLGVTPEFGTSPKLCAVIIDADIPIDHPRDLNVDEFCSRCRLCQKSCPVGAIPKETMQWMGANKRKLHEKKCWTWMVDHKGCGICMKVCPYNHFGYERCMDSIPQYYRYNTMEKYIGQEGKTRWQ